MNFSAKVLKLAEKIPKGYVSTYGDIARKLDSRAYRAVGMALHRNDNLVVVPCHRVVSSEGATSGYALGVKKKIALLKIEGVIVSKGKIVDFEKKLYKF